MRLKCFAFGLAVAFCAVAAVRADSPNESSPPEVLRLPGVVAAESTSTQAVPAPLSRLEDFESLALSAHPSIWMIEAQIHAARCRCYQKGLPPNPEAGYVASEIGNDGAAGQQGMYVGQRFIRGRKLHLDQQVVSREIQRLEQQLAGERVRVRTDVRTAFYNAYLSQLEVELSERLVEVSNQAADAVGKLYKAQEARKSDVLQAEIESQRIAAKLRQARLGRIAAWRALATAAAQPDLEQRPVAADLDTLRWNANWESTRAALLSGSPEVAAAHAEINRRRAAWRRARAEPIPDLDAQLSVQYDDSAHGTIAGVQLGMPIPLWNRNQGGICEACHEITAAKRGLELLELRLTQELTQRLQQYQAAQTRADAYRDQVLSRAQQNMKLIKQAFDAGEATYLDLLTVQRTYFESNLEFLAAMREVNTSVQLLTGFLIDGSRQ